MRRAAAAAARALLRASRRASTLHTPMLHDVVIVGAVRTPFGGLLGSVSGLTAPQLGGAAIAAALAAARTPPGDVDEVYFGCVLQAGVGQAPARQAALLAGVEADATTINKVCASGMKAVSLAAQSIACGAASVAVAGGMESMSRAPHIIRGLRAGMRLGGGALEDGLLVDGLTCSAGGGVHMGTIADAVAAAAAITRETMDAHALESHARAAAAAAGARDGTRAHGAEVVPVLAPPPLGARGKGDELAWVVEDDAPAKLDAGRVPSLRPAFGAGGAVTAATSSPVSDGAAAVVLASSTAAAAAGARVIAHVVACADAAVAPHRYPHAPAAAARAALARAGLTVTDVDLWEINEAFSVVALVAAAELGVDPARVNAAGGAVALGHPIGASGAALVARLAHELAARGLSVGVAAICNGGGGATAVVLRRTPPDDGE